MTGNKCVSIVLTLFLCCFVALRVSAQESDNYQNKEHVANSGGNPSPTLVSSNYQITLSSLGDGLSGGALDSSGYKVDGGFGISYPPPGEVLDLKFLDGSTFGWSPEASVGNYNVYRGNISDLSLGYGACFVNGTTSVTAVDAEVPPAGQCFFYLVTAENKISEEGTMGDNSSEAPRNNASPCS